VKVRAGRDTLCGFEAVSTQMYEAMLISNNAVAANTPRTDLGGNVDASLQPTVKVLVKTLVNKAITAKLLVPM